MTLQEAIRKAILGGYQGDARIAQIKENNPVEEGEQLSPELFDEVVNDYSRNYGDLGRMLLDREFWKGFGDEKGMVKLATFLTEGGTIEKFFESLS